MLDAPFSGATNHYRSPQHHRRQRLADCQCAAVQQGDFLAFRYFHPYPHPHLRAEAAAGGGRNDAEFNPPDCSGHDLQHRSTYGTGTRSERTAPTSNKAVPAGKLCRGRKNFPQLLQGRFRFPVRRHSGRIFCRPPLPEAINQSEAIEELLEQMLLKGENSWYLKWRLAEYILGQETVASPGREILSWLVAQ